MVDASFKVPDERQWKPWEERIVETMEFKETLNSPMDVDGILDSLKGRGFDVEESTDPGRFVCNWV